MGCGGSKVDATTKDIDRQIKDDKKKAKYEVKLLLLGSGESGKTTILKQMKLIHDDGFSEDERENFREIVFSNIRSCMLAILNGMEKLGIALEGDLEKERTRALDEDAPPDFKVISALWKDPGVQAAFQRSNEYQLPDCAKFFLDDLNRISAQGNNLLFFFFFFFFIKI